MTEPLLYSSISPLPHSCSTPWSSMCIILIASPMALIIANQSMDTARICVCLHPASTSAVRASPAPVPRVSSSCRMDLCASKIVSSFPNYPFCLWTSVGLSVLSKIHSMDIAAVAAAAAAVIASTARCIRGCLPTCLCCGCTHHRTMQLSFIKAFNICSFAF